MFVHPSFPGHQAPGHWLRVPADFSAYTVPATSRALATVTWIMVGKPMGAAEEAVDSGLLGSSAHAAVSFRIVGQRL